MNINICDIRKDWSAMIFNKTKSWKYFWIPQQSELSLRCIHTELLEFQTYHLNPSNLKPFWHIITIFTIKMSLTLIFLAKMHKISPLWLYYWQDGQLTCHLPKWLYFDVKIITNCLFGDLLQKLWCILSCLTTGQSLYIHWLMMDH